MKKLILSLLLLLGAFNSKADQYQIVSEDDAIMAVEILNSQNDVFLWCDCCDGDYLRFIEVQSASYEYAYGEGNDCYVFLSGYDENGDWFEESIDLAYTYIADGEWAIRLSNYMGLEADPCYDEPISYYDYYPFGGGDGYEEDSYDEEYVDEYSYDSEEEYADAPYDSETVFGYLTGMDCGDYCYLYFDSPDYGPISTIVIDPSEYPAYFFDSEYGYYLNPYYENAEVNVTYQIIEYENEDGTYGQELVVIGIELAG